MKDMKAAYLDEGEWLCAECRYVGGPDEDLLEHYLEEHPDYMEMEIPEPRSELENNSEP